MSINSSQLTLKYDSTKIPNFDAALAHSNKIEQIDRSYMSEHELSKEVYTTDEIAQFEETMTSQHKDAIMTGFYRNKIETNATIMWNKFYTRNNDRFFKDRHYFSQSIPQLVTLSADYSQWLSVQLRFKQYLIDHHGFIDEIESSVLSSSTTANTETANDFTFVQSNTTIATPEESSSLPALSSSSFTPSMTMTITIDPDNATFFSSFSTADIALLQQSKSPPVLAEIGCGVGNTFWPVLEDFPYFHLLGCDCASSAISLIKEQPQYNPNSINVSVCDISKQILPFEDNSADIVTLIYTLSALNPDAFHHVLSECYRILKPNGVFHIRDYAIYDLTMLRFKKGSRLSHTEPYFARGDGTRTYFFERERLKTWMSNAGFNVDDDQVLYIKKIIGNKKMELEMHRRWIVGYGTKPFLPTQDGTFQTKPVPSCDCSEHLKARQEDENNQSH